MVTLQILVLSFLVRIQVAQLKRSSFEGRFFVVSTGNVVGGALCALAAFDSLVFHHTLSIVVPPDSHLRAVEPIDVSLVAMG